MGIYCWWRVHKVHLHKHFMFHCLLESKFLEPCHQIVSLFSFIFSIFVCSALGNILGKFGVPYLTFPFNLLAIVTFLSLQTIYPALPKEEINALGYNCTSSEIGFVVNKKTDSIQYHKLYRLASSLFYITILYSSVFCFK